MTCRVTDPCFLTERPPTTKLPLQHFRLLIQSSLRHVSPKNGSQRCSFRRKGEERKNGRKGKKENICSLLWLPVYNPSAWTAKAGGLQWVQGQPELYIAIYSKASSHEHCFQDYLSVCVWMGQCTWMEGTGQRQMPSSWLCTLCFVCVWVFVCAPYMRSAPTRQKRVSLEL